MVDDTWILWVAGVTAVAYVMDRAFSSRERQEDTWQAVVEEVEKRRLVVPRHGTVYYEYVVHYRRDDGTRDIFKVAERDESSSALALINARAGSRLIKRAGSDYPVLGASDSASSA